MIMKEKILKIILILLIIVLISFIGFLIYENKDNSSNKDTAPKVTDVSSKLIELSDDVKEQTVEGYKFSFARLYYGKNKSTFLVNIYNENDNDEKKLNGIKINFIDNNDNLIYSIDVPNVLYISYPYMYSTTVDVDLSNTKSIKYELEYEE